MPRCMGTALAILAAGMAAATAAPAGTVPSRVYQEEFRLGDRGEHGAPGWREDSPETAEMLAESGCRSLGLDCSEAQGPEGSMRYMKRMIRSGDYQGTAEIGRMRGRSYYAKFVAPKGFTTCRAGIFLKEGSIGPAATFAGSIQRSGRDGLAVYADLGDPAALPRRIAFRLLVQYVASGSAASKRCWPDLTLVFVCRPASGCRASRAYPEADLR